jgi:hypothetical protein
MSIMNGTAGLPIFRMASYAGPEVKLEESLDLE